MWRTKGICMCVLFSSKDFRCTSFIVILLQEMAVVLNIMPMLIFWKRRFILAILNVVFFFLLSRYLPLWPSPSVLVKVHFSLVAEVKDPIPVIARDWLSSLWLTCTTQKKDFERSHHQMTAETLMFQREHSTVPRGRTEWDLATSGDWLAINNAMGTLTIQLMLSRALHTCFHEITAWTLRCLVGSDGRTAGTAEQQLYFFFPL